MASITKATTETITTTTTPIITAAATAGATEEYPRLSSLSEVDIVVRVTKTQKVRCRKRDHVGFICALHIDQLAVHCIG